VLGAITIAEIQQNPAKYAEHHSAGDGTIDHIVASQANRGQTRIRGADVSASATASRKPASAPLTPSWMAPGITSMSSRARRMVRGCRTSASSPTTAAIGGAGPNSGLAGMPQMNPRWKHTAA
jgi:iron complex outermembrane receptor protein